MQSKNKMLKDKRHLFEDTHKNERQLFFVVDFLSELRLTPPAGIVFEDEKLAHSQVVYQNFGLLILKGISSATLGYPFYFITQGVGYENKNW